MASIQEALASLRQEMGSQQSRRPVVQDETPHDLLPPPPSPLGPMMSQAPPYILLGYFEVAPCAVVQIAVLEDTHAHMDSIEQRIRQSRVFDSSSAWDDLDSTLRYTGVGYPRIHLRLCCFVMRAHGLDKSQMITMFTLSLSGASQCWFASLESSRYRT
ncbi:hypothetical protein PVL29_014571 [Vitis rotundifolia]|uniref:Retrotransposon gag domain-containing protein n=1 Tax=Vitis rotundifolia TaxID=103349 RepID=A0AA38ZH65_VITRO|nr:hypothetical protein PVL29_014571 [Vitis rotundifolia]